MATSPAIKANFDNLHQQVLEHGGVLTTDMRDLRERLQAGKLGRYIIESISDELKSRGLGSSSLTNEQTDKVRIYKRGTRLARFVESSLSVGEAHDEALRELSESNADAILKQIRALVCP